MALKAIFYSIMGWNQFWKSIFISMHIRFHMVCIRYIHQIKTQSLNKESWFFFHKIFFENEFFIENQNRPNAYITFICTGKNNTVFSSMKINNQIFIKKSGIFVSGLGFQIWRTSCYIYELWCKTQLEKKLRKDRKNKHAPSKFNFTQLCVCS